MKNISKGLNSNSKDCHQIYLDFYNTNYKFNFLNIIKIFLFKNLNIVESISTIFLKKLSIFNLLFKNTVYQKTIGMFMINKFKKIKNLTTNSQLFNCIFKEIKNNKNLFFIDFFNLNNKNNIKSVFYSCENHNLLITKVQYLRTMLFLVQEIESVHFNYMPLKGKDFENIEIKEMIHGLRNPLAGIQGFSELILKNYFKDKTLKEYFSAILSGCKHMNSIMNSYLKKTSRLSIQMRVIDIKKEINYCLNIMKKKPNIKVFVSTHAKTVFIAGDRKHLRTAILNIINNAVDALYNRNGIINIRLFSYDEKYICLSVQDNGIGISQLISNNLFKPLRTTKKSGSGIGLFQSKNIIEGHGGKLSIFSNTEGTNVSIFIPSL